MSAVALVQQADVPDDENVRTVTCEIDVLAAAMHLAFLAGNTEAREMRETLMFLQRTIRNMQRSLRKARPAPREGIEAGLDLILRAVDERLGVRAEDEFRVAR